MSSRLWSVLGRPISGRIAVRWSTVLMVVAFFGLGWWYLQVRTDPTTTKITVPVNVVTTSTTTPSVTEPVEHPSTTTTSPAEAPTGTDSTDSSSTTTTTTAGGGFGGSTTTTTPSGSTTAPGAPTTTTG